MKNFFKTCFYEIQSIFLLLTQTTKSLHDHLTIKHHEDQSARNNSFTKKIKKWWR